jgi:hypothetical protein
MHSGRGLLAPAEADRRPDAPQQLAAAVASQYALTKTCSNVTQVNLSQTTAAKQDAAAAAPASCAAAEGALAPTAPPSPTQRPLARAGTAEYHGHRPGWNAASRSAAWGWRRAPRRPPNIKKHRPGQSRHTVAPARQLARARAWQMVCGGTGGPGATGCDGFIGSCSSATTQEATAPHVCRSRGCGRRPDGQSMGGC